MEHNDRLLDVFSSSMIGYFNEVLIKKNCVISTFQKDNVRNCKDVDFILILRSSCDDSYIYHTDSSFLTEETIRISSDVEDFNDLTSLRLKLLKTTVENLLLVGGYKIKDEEENCCSRENLIGEGETVTLVRVSCGPVVNSTTKMRITQITPAEYRKILMEELESTSNKNSNPELLESLVDSIIAINLLQVRSNHSVSLNLNKGEKETASKGGVFLQYNASRLAAIREKYKEHVQEGIYPEILKPQDIDFSVLKEPEEWALAFNFILEYPALIDRILKAMVTGTSYIHQLCDFLTKLCSLFSVYYRRVRILLKPKDHLLQTIQARVLLAQCVEQVLENGFAILNIKKIEKM